MSTSQNGWPVHTTSTGLTPLPWITGRVAPATVVVFDHLGARFNAEVEKINPAASWGWDYRAIRGETSGYSNHASGTAVDFNAPQHPLGKTGTFTPKQVAAIHAILEDFDGAIRWGGDYTGRLDSMHFEVNVSATALAKVTARLSAPVKPTPVKPTPVKPTPVKPTRVSNARVLLSAALAVAVAQHHPKRAAAIRAALKLLPTR